MGLRTPFDREGFLVVFIVLPVLGFLSLELALALAVNLTRWSAP